MGSRSLEFVEIKNLSNDTIDLTEWYFSKGIDYNFPLNTIIYPDSFLVIVSDSTNFQKVYSKTIFDQFNGNLNNGGEKILLADPLGDTCFYVNFK